MTASKLPLLNPEIWLWSPVAWTATEPAVSKATEGRSLGWTGIGLAWFLLFFLLLACVCRNDPPKRSRIKPRRSS